LRFGVEVGPFLSQEIPMARSHSLASKLENVGVDWSPSNDRIGKNPGMLPKLRCAADDADFLQRQIDRSRERIRARQRQSAGIVDDDTNHRRGKSDRPKRKPQPASSGKPAPVAAHAAADDIPF